MYKKLIGFIVLAALITGCKANANSAEPVSPGTVEQTAGPYSAVDTYGSLEELMQAYNIATASDTRAISESAEEKVYYLTDGNNLGLSLAKIEVKESYFNCIYNDGICVITNRYEDGASALKSITSTNTNTFTNEQADGYEYYYVSDEDYKYYLWLNDGVYMNLNVPIGVDIDIKDIMLNLESMAL